MKHKNTVMVAGPKLREASLQRSRERENKLDAYGNLRAHLVSEEREIQERISKAGGA